MQPPRQTLEYGQPRRPLETSDRHVPDYGRPRRPLWNSWWPVIITLVVVIGGIILLGLASMHP